jgi:hypothetical protein
VQYARWPHHTAQRWQLISWLLQMRARQSARVELLNFFNATTWPKMRINCELPDEF